MKSFSTSYDGKLLNYRKDYTTQDIQDIIMFNHLTGLSFSTHAVDKSDLPNNLDFLLELFFLEKLVISSLKPYDYSVINKLSFLKVLYFNVGLLPDKSFVLNLSGFTQLEDLTLACRELKGDFGINHLKLKRLMLDEFLKRTDLSLIRDMSTLEFFRIANGSVKSLDGLQNNKNLKELWLGACRSLTSISAINGFNELEMIFIDGCSKITDYDQLTELKGLKRLRIVDSKIPSLKFIKNFPNLEEIWILGTSKILDGDVTSLQNLPESIKISAGAVMS